MTVRELDNALCGLDFDAEVILVTYVNGVKYERGIEDIVVDLRDVEPTILITSPIV